VLRLFWLGEIKASCPELFPQFFKADLGPPVGEFLSLSLSRKGGC